MCQRVRCSDVTRVSRCAYHVPTYVQLYAREHERVCRGGSHSDMRFAPWLGYAEAEEEGEGGQGQGGE